MIAVLWTLQGLLALVFLLHGLLLAGVFPTPETMRERLENSGQSRSFLAFIGWAEGLAAFGLLLPIPTGIAPWLTPLAALGLAVIMAGATVLHLRKGEAQESTVTFVLALLLGVVVYGRWPLVPFV